MVESFKFSFINLNTKSYVYYFHNSTLSWLLKRLVNILQAEILIIPVWSSMYKGYIERVYTGMFRNPDMNLQQCVMWACQWFCTSAVQQTYFHCSWNPARLSSINHICAANDAEWRCKCVSAVYVSLCVLELNVLGHRRHTCDSPSFVGSPSTRSDQMRPNLPLCFWEIAERERGEGEREGAREPSLPSPFLLNSTYMSLIRERPDWRCWSDKIPICSLPTHPHSQSPSHKINFVICLVRYAGTHQEDVCVCFVKCRRDPCLLHFNINLIVQMASKVSTSQEVKGTCLLWPWLHVWHQVTTSFTSAGLDSDFYKDLAVTHICFFFCCPPLRWYTCISLMCHTSAWTSLWALEEVHFTSPAL